MAALLVVMAPLVARADDQPATAPTEPLPAYPTTPPPYVPPPRPPVAPTRATVDAGLSLTGSTSSWLHPAFMLEVGLNVPRIPSPYFVRLHLAASVAGSTMQSDWSGMYARRGAGVELGGCTSWICPFAQLVLAYQHADLHDNCDDLVEDRKGPHFYTRGGVDLGARRLHLRAALEFGRWKTHSTPAYWHKTGGIFLGVGVRF